MGKGHERRDVSWVCRCCTKQTCLVPVPRARGESVRGKLEKETWGDGDGSMGRIRGSGAPPSRAAETDVRVVPCSWRQGPGYAS